MRSSKELIDKMHRSVGLIERELQNHELSADVQIDDINLLCWNMVELALKLQDAVRQELSDLE